MRLLRAADRTPVPWKNGGGLTREIAVHPPGAGLDDFAWRISSAEVSADGPFSRFDGVDRVLVVLSGDGLELTIGDRPAEILTAASPPRAFPGDTPTHARLAGGPVTDLNIMTRRGAWTATVTRGPAERGRGRAEVTLLFLLGPGRLVAPRQALDPGDVLVLDPGEGVTWDMAPDAITIRLSPN